MLILRSHGSDSKEPPEESADLPPEPHTSSAPIARGAAPRGLAVAWVQFLKADIAEAVNTLHNRLHVIANAATVNTDGPSGDQVEALETIRAEIQRATRITSGLTRRINALAPDTMPSVSYEYDEAKTLPARVLVVEDDDAIRQVLVRALNKKGHSVKAVTNGLEAFDELEASGADCIVCDVRMPFADGRTLFEQVEYKMPHVASRFLFVTGDYTNPESREFLQQTGQPYIGKPFDLQELLGAVNILLHAVPPTSERSSSPGMKANGS